MRSTSAAVDLLTSGASIRFMKLSDYLAKHKISQSAFAEKLGVSQGLIYQWLAEKRPVAAEQCPRIEMLTNGEIRCEDLNDRVDWAFIRSRPAVAEPVKEDA